MTGIDSYVTTTILVVLVVLLYGLVRVAFGPEAATQHLPGRNPNPKHALHRHEIQLLVLGLIFVLFMLVWRVAR